MGKFIKTILVICVIDIIIFAAIFLSKDERNSNMNAPVDNTPTEQNQYNTATPYYPKANVVTPEELLKLKQQIENLNHEPQRQYYSETPDDAYSIGYANGYEQGLSDGRNGYSHGYGYDDSCNYYDYYETRYQEGYEEGYNEGYALGANEFEENQDDDNDDDEDDW